MAFIDSSAVNIALAALQNTLHATVIDVQWVVEAYGLVLGALILVGGTLGDLLGRRLIFVAGTAVFALASAACGTAPSIGALIVARSLQGAGAALLVPSSLAIISTSFDEKRRGQAIGTWSGWTAITTAVGPVLGGWLVEHASWRWVFFINLPLAVAVICISIWHIPESRRAGGSRVDWPGAVLVTLGLSGLVFGLLESSRFGWGSAVVAASLLAAVLCLAGFAAVEARTAWPMVPLGLFRNRYFSGANMLTLFLYAATGAFFFFFPLNLIQVHRYTATAAGGAMLPLILLMFLLSRWSGGLVARYGPGKPLIVGALIVALGFALFAIAAPGADYWRAYFPAVTILGFGMAVIVAPLTTDVMNSVDGDHVGTASGINNAVARVAGVLGIAVLGIVMVAAFRARLDHALTRLPLPAGAVAQMHAQETRLAELQPPMGLDAAQRATVTDLIRRGFMFGFRIIMLLCMALAVASAVVARWMIAGSGSGPGASRVEGG